jgi:hypothetical protein
MREDFRVPALDSLDIWKIAKAQRRRLVRQNADRVDVLGCLEATGSAGPAARKGAVLDPAERVRRLDDVPGPAAAADR